MLHYFSYGLHSLLIQDCLSASQPIKNIITKNKVLCLFVFLNPCDAHFMHSVTQNNNILVHIVLVAERFCLVELKHDHLEIGINQIQIKQQVKQMKIMLLYFSLFNFLIHFMYLFLEFAFLKSSLFVLHYFIVFTTLLFSLFYCFSRGENINSNYMFRHYKAI